MYIDTLMAHSVYAVYRNYMSTTLGHIPHVKNEERRFYEHMSGNAVSDIEGVKNAS